MVKKKDSEFIACTPKKLPEALTMKAARIAIKENPANSPIKEGIGPISAARLALITKKYWGVKGVDLSVQFLESVQPAIKAKILSHMNAWGKWGKVQFTETAGKGQVRIAFGKDGYWSYLGTDILSIPMNQPTMNLQGFSGTMPESEYYRVVRHETGHTLGFPHEHMRREIVSLLDPQKTIAYFGKTQGWDAQTVREQILTPLEDVEITATPEADQISIMTYQLSGECTKSGQPIIGGTDIDLLDQKFIAQIYPKSGPVDPPPPPPPPPVDPEPLCVLTCQVAIRKGEKATFKSPVDVPVGSKMKIYPPAARGQEQDQLNFVE